MIEKNVAADEVEVEGLGGEGADGDDCFAEGGED